MAKYEVASLLYSLYLCFTFTSRMWDMAIVLLIAEATNNSLLIVAFTGFVTSLVSFLLMPLVGNWLDKTDRLYSAQIVICIKVVAVSMAYTICALLHQDNGEKMRYESLLLYVLPFVCASAGLTFTTISQLIERDWVVVLSDKDTLWLSNVNSSMSQIDLGCKSIAPAVTGVLFSSMSSTHVSITMLLVNLIAASLLYMFMKSLYYNVPLLSVKDISDASLPTTSPSSSQQSNKIEGKCSSMRNDIPVAEVDGSTTSSATSSRIVIFKDFFNSGCAGVMVSYAFLYLTVLSFGSLMTVYLRWAGVSDRWIGISSGFAALVEFTGASLFPWFNKKMGLWNTAYKSIWYQCFFVVAAAVTLLIKQSSSLTSSPLTSSSLTRYNVILIVSVLLSRLGLWMFDLCSRQLSQEILRESVRGKVNGQWRAIISFFDMSSYGLAIMYSDPQHFYILTTISAAMIVAAATVYTNTMPIITYSRNSIHGSTSSSNINGITGSSIHGSTSNAKLIDNNYKFT